MTVQEAEALWKKMKDRRNSERLRVAEDQLAIPPPREHTDTDPLELPPLPTPLPPCAAVGRIPSSPSLRWYSWRWWRP